MPSSDVVSDVSAEQLRIKSLVSFVVSIMSLLGAAFIVITILVMRLYKPHIANRVSIWLTFWKALADIFYSIVYLISQHSVVNLATCKFVLWGYVEFTLLSIFLTCTIAFNLQAIFVNEFNSMIAIQRFYFPLSLILSLAISIIPLIADQFVFDPLVGNCWYRDQYTTPAMIWEMTTFYGWIFLGVVYCTIAVALVTTKLVRNEKRLRQNVSPGTAKLNRNINNVVARIILYPVIPILTQSFNFITEVVTFFSRRLVFPLYFLSSFGPASIGFLNFLVFLFDPAFRRLIKELRSGTSTEPSTSPHDMDTKSGSEAYELSSSFHVSTLFREPEGFKDDSTKKTGLPTNNMRPSVPSITNGHERQDSIGLENDSTPLSHNHQTLSTGQNSSLELILDSSDTSSTTTRSANLAPYQAPEGGFKPNVVRYM
ncbi:hypothetical protein K493DRAFT_388750 [Basidiobolus meristosporus CBS 931.73]|uniref:G-protein coupled receptors family 2 profile 2 domain-containing protein n=1 Tax=Basidiobolus meristosporus CBS 931.73 TaxID=1314790 RepID=A0A1Y1X959_9FUNG|nr:hypothetical protein K493DRAFT_388750 [Basidiobolus meristosporus CBS 931.73]|eukprot:ORX82311.1 hypothetical protein K493DRAFT_388750 [Basidiobolus meristosporus CBS 931.73]